MLKLKGRLEDYQETTQDATKVVVAPEVKAPFTDSGDSFTQLDLADLSVQRTLPIVGLIDALRTSIVGIVILTYYKNNGELNDNCRNHLADAFIRIEICADANLT